MALKMAARPDTATRTYPSVGVVIPAHNAAPFIEQALASVAGQSCRPHRVIVVDDLSSDGTADLAESWADRLPITVLRLTENVGSGEARRRAIAQLDTDLIAPLDADDVWLPDHLEHLVEVWRSQPNAVVSARAEVWRPGEPRVDYHRSLGLRIPKRNQLSALLAGNFVFFGSVFSRKDYERVGGFGSQRGWEDWELWVKMAANRVPILVADFPTVLYRRHATNLTQDVSAFDRALLERIGQFRQQHPEWLTEREWNAVQGHRQAMLHFNRAMAMIRGHQLAGAAELARAVRHGGPRLIVHIGRQAGFRVRNGNGARFR